MRGVRTSVWFSPLRLRESLSTTCSLPGKLNAWIGGWCTTRIPGTISARQLLQDPDAVLAAAKQEAGIAKS